MALSVEETEFLNRVDQVLSKNINHMKDQFNAILDNANPQALLDIAQSLHDAQNRMIIYEAIMLISILIAIWYFYYIFSGRFIDIMHEKISTQLIKNFNEIHAHYEVRVKKLEATYKIQFDLAKETNTLLHQQNLYASSTLRSVSEFEQKLEKLAQENMRLHAELSKTQNILRKKIKKEEKDAGQQSEYSYRDM